MTRANGSSPYVRLRIERATANQRVTRLDIVSAIERELASSSGIVGFRLPPARVLQHQLRVEKNTVNGAYRELAARGLVEGNGHGYVVAARRRPRRRAQSRPPALPELREARMVSASSSERRGINLGSPFIDPDLLPRERLAQCFRAVLKDTGLPYDYSAQGYAPLRALIAKRLMKRGIAARAEDIILTTGSQQAMDLVTRSLKKRTMAIENPTYGVGKRMFEVAGVGLTSLPLDPFTGIDPASWQERIESSRPALLYLTTNFQNPTGYSYSTAELHHVIALSKKFDVGLLEDDWGSDMLSYSEYRPPLRALGGENVLYLNSFTKKLLPSLRIGYMLANERTRHALLEAKHVATLGSATIVETVLFEFLDRGYYDEHLSALQAELDVRYHACIDTLESVMPEGVRWTTPGGGPTLWLELPRCVNLALLTERMAEKDVLLPTPLQDWFSGTPHLHGTRLGYAHLPVATMMESLERLSQEVRRQIR